MNNQKLLAMALISTGSVSAMDRYPQGDDAYSARKATFPSDCVEQKQPSVVSHTSEKNEQAWIDDQVKDVNENNVNLDEVNFDELMEELDEMIAKKKIMARNYHHNCRQWLNCARQRIVDTMSMCDKDREELQEAAAKIKGERKKFVGSRDLPKYHSFIDDIAADKGDLRRKAEKQLATRKKKYERLSQLRLSIKNCKRFAEDSEKGKTGIQMRLIMTKRYADLGQELDDRLKWSDYNTDSSIEEKKIRKEFKTLKENEFAIPATVKKLEDQLHRLLKFTKNKVNEYKLKAEKRDKLDQYNRTFECALYINNLKIYDSYIENLRKSKDEMKSLGHDTDSIDDILDRVETDLEKQLDIILCIMNSYSKDFFVFDDEQYFRNAVKKVKEDKFEMPANLDDLAYQVKALVEFTTKKIYSMRINTLYKGLYELYKDSSLYKWYQNDQAFHQDNLDFDRDNRAFIYQIYIKNLKINNYIAKLRESKDEMKSLGHDTDSIDDSLDRVQKEIKLFEEQCLDQESL